MKRSGMIVYLHASAMMRKGIAMAQNDEASVSETFPLPLELRSVSPEKFEDLKRARFSTFSFFSNFTFSVVRSK